MLLQTELSAFLGYDKHAFAGFNSGDSRNGSYKRYLDTKYGKLLLTIPRARNVAFDQQTLKPCARRTDDLATTVIQLYSHGVTTSEIAQLIERMYGHHCSKTTVSNITEVVSQAVDAFHQRQLAKQYAAIYMDATFLPMRRDSVQKEAIHIVIGIEPNGHKEILDCLIAPNESPNESSQIYLEMLQSFKARGLDQVLLFVADGFSGLPHAIEQVYPFAHFQQ